jgi:hypothetical protein
VLTLHRRGLESVTRALLEHETLDGDTAAQLIDEANGEPVWPKGTKTVSALSGVGSKAASNGSTAEGSSKKAPADPSPLAPLPKWDPPTLPAV